MSAVDAAVRVSIFAPEHTLGPVAGYIACLCVWCIVCAFTIQFKWGRYVSPKSSDETVTGCHCCATPVADLAGNVELGRCANEKPLISHWLKTEIEMHTSTIFHVVCVWGWLYGTHPVMYGAVGMCGFASWMHHWKPRVGSIWHFCDNTATLFTVPNTWEWAPVLIAVPVAGLLISYLLEKQKLIIKALIVVAIVWDYAYCFYWASALKYRIYSTIGALGTAYIYSSVDKSPINHTLWHFIICFFIAGTEGGMP